MRSPESRRNDNCNLLGLKDNLLYGYHKYPRSLSTFRLSRFAGQIETADSFDSGWQKANPVCGSYPATHPSHNGIVHYLWAVQIGSPKGLRCLSCRSVLFRLDTTGIAQVLRKYIHGYMFCRVKWAFGWTVNTKTIKLGVNYWKYCAVFNGLVLAQAV